MEFILNDILAIILGYLPRDGTNSRINAILTCKKWKEVYLTKVLPPWKIFPIYIDRTDYCGLMGSFDVNKNTINKSYFYHWYNLFPKLTSFNIPQSEISRCCESTSFNIPQSEISRCCESTSFNIPQSEISRCCESTSFKKDFLLKYGDHFFVQSCELYDLEDRKEMVLFFLNEFISLKFAMSEISKAIGNGITHILYSEDIDLAYTIFIDYCYIPIDEKILKKWCTILCHRREMPGDKIKRKNRIQLVAWIKNRPEMTKYRIKGIDYFYY